MKTHGTFSAGYNGDGLRAVKQTAGATTYFLYDGTTLVCEMDASGAVTATNTFGANGLVSRRTGTASIFYTFDPQGSVAQRLDASGNLLSNDLYDAYGNKLAGNPGGDPVGYGGQWGYYTDVETGLILCTYRCYNPSLGRWLTRDPIGYEGGINLYGYVKGNPVTFQDSLGQSREECIKLADEAARRHHDNCEKAYRRHHNNARRRACHAAARAAYYARISACYGEEAADATFDWCYANRKPIIIGTVIIVGGGIIIVATGGAAAPVLVAL